MQQSKAIVYSFTLYCIARMLLLINYKGLLKNLDIIEVRVSDHYNLTLAAIKTQASGLQLY